MLGRIALILGAGAVSWALTYWVRSYAVAHALVDIPKPRSSHSVPTPRGGGLAIAIAVLLGVTVAGLLNWIPLRVSVALVGGGLLVSAIGWMDDHSDVSRRARVIVHFMAAGWALYWLGGLPSLDLGILTVPFGVVGTGLAIIGIVWCVNFYNFMDGIDGIAAGEAVNVGLIGGLLLLSSGNAGLATVAVLVAAGSAGFLIWNWAPAKIFMGDVGSGFLGFVFGALAVASENNGGVPLLVWVMLLGFFISDATVTLGRRIARGERWYDAHRSHVYQRAVQSGWSHARMTATVLAINLGLGLLAWIVVVEPSLVLPAFLAGMVGLAWFFVFVERRQPMGAATQG